MSETVEHPIDTCEYCSGAIELDSDGCEIEVGSDQGAGGVAHECDEGPDSEDGN